MKMQCFESYFLWSGPCFAALSLGGAIGDDDDYTKQCSRDEMR